MVHDKLKTWTNYVFVTYKNLVDKNDKKVGEKGHF